MGILGMIANALQILAYFFNPKLREQRDREKVWAIFHDLEDKLAKALADKDMYAVDKIRHWLQDMRDKYAYIKEGSK
jgi:hypothetical protein